MRDARLPLVAPCLRSAMLLLAAACAPQTSPPAAGMSPPPSAPSSTPNLSPASAANGPPKPATAAAPASAVPAPSASAVGPQMVFPTSKLTVAGKSLSDISKEELKAALAKHCAPGFAPIDGISAALGRWENIGIHCGKPPDQNGSSKLMLSVDLWRPRPVAQRDGTGNDSIASPQNQLARMKGVKSMPSRYDEPAAVLIYVGGPHPEKTLADLVKER